MQKISVLYPPAAAGQPEPTVDPDNVSFLGDVALVENDTALAFPSTASLTAVDNSGSWELTPGTLMDINYAGLHAALIESSTPVKMGSNFLFSVDYPAAVAGDNLYSASVIIHPAYMDIIASVQSGNTLYPDAKAISLMATAANTQVDIQGDATLDSETYNFGILGGTSLLYFAGEGVTFQHPLDGEVVAPAGTTMTMVKEDGAGEGVIMSTGVLTPDTDYAISVLMLFTGSTPVMQGGPVVVDIATPATNLIPFTIDHTTAKTQGEFTLPPELTMNAMYRITQRGILHGKNVKPGDTAIFIDEGADSILLRYVDDDNLATLDDIPSSTFKLGNSFPIEGYYLTDNPPLGIQWLTSYWINKIAVVRAQNNSVEEPNPVPSAFYIDRASLTDGDVVGICYLGYHGAGNFEPGDPNGPVVLVAADAGGANPTWPVLWDRFIYTDLQLEENHAYADTYGITYYFKFNESQNGFILVNPNDISSRRKLDTFDVLPGKVSNLEGAVSNLLPKLLARPPVATAATCNLLTIDTPAPYLGGAFSELNGTKIVSIRDDFSVVLDLDMAFGDYPAGAPSTTYLSTLSFDGAVFKSTRHTYETPIVYKSFDIFNILKHTDTERVSYARIAGVSGVDKTVHTSLINIYQYDNSPGGAITSNISYTTDPGETTSEITDPTTVFESVCGIDVDANDYKVLVWTNGGVVSRRGIAVLNLASGARYTVESFNNAVYFGGEPSTQFSRYPGKLFNLGGGYFLAAPGTTLTTDGRCRVLKYQPEVVDNPLDVVDVHDSIQGFGFVVGTNVVDVIRRNDNKYIVVSKKDGDSYNLYAHEYTLPPDAGGVGETITIPLLGEKYLGSLNHKELLFYNYADNGAVVTEADINVRELRYLQP